MHVIDLRSDTVTKPTLEMRQAMYDAEVGDDVYGEDPTVLKLEETTAEILGKEAALFVTSGTQGNQICILTHARSGEELLLEADSHIFYYEAAAASAFAGVQTRTLPGEKGQMDLSELALAVRGDNIHFPKTALIALENTHNRAGGAVLPLSYMKSVQELAIGKGVPIHLDGARLFNAAAALNCEVHELTQYVDTVQVCLSKGLCAPVGSLIAGSKEFIEKARVWRKRMGGGLRQVGVLAAPGLIAIRDMRGRLAEDHANAKFLAAGLAEIPGFEINPDEVMTNIVIVETQKSGLDSMQILDRLKQEGILAVDFGPTTVRFVTHHDVSKKDMEEALTRISRAIGGGI